MRSLARVVAIAVALSSSAAWASPECDQRTAEMREELERVSKRADGPIEVPSMVADWVRELIRRFQAEKDAAKRAVLVGEAWPKAIGSCQKEFARVFAEGASLEGRAKVDHLKRAIPDAFLACGCTGADPDALEVLMAMASRDILREVRVEQKKQNTEAARVAGVKKLTELIRGKGALYRIVKKGKENELACERWRFRPRRSPLKGVLDGPTSINYEWLDGTLQLSEEEFGCFFRLTVASSRPDALLLAGDKVSEAVYLTPAACQTALASGRAAPVQHLCTW